MNLGFPTATSRANAASRTTSNATAVAVLVAFALSLFAHGAALAQPGHEGHNHAAGGHGQANKTNNNKRPLKPAKSAQPTRAATQKAKADAPKGFTNVDGKTSRTAAFLFWLLALLVIAGSIFVITRRNMVTAVMGMVGTFIAIAGLYAMLYAHFLAAIQVVVYAGAIMVLFVFVVMILNRPEDEPWAIQGVVGKVIAGLSLAYLLYRLVDVLWSVKDLPHAVEAPVVAGGFEFGSTKAVGKTLFTDYLFPFEAVSIVLLVSVVGAIAIARPKKPEDELIEEPASDGAGA